MADYNYSRIGLLPEGDGTTGKRWRMRYHFTVGVQMTSFTARFKLNTTLYGQVAVGITRYASTIAPRDYTFTMSSTTVTANFNYTLQPGVTYYLWLDYAGSRFEYATCPPANVTIEAIPAASTLTASNGTLGQEQTLTINAGSDSFTHTVQYAVGSVTGTIASNTSSKTLTWTPSMDLAKQNISGKSVNCTFTVITYVNGTENARSSKTVSYAIPASEGPTLSAELGPDNGTMPAAFAALYVQGRSKLKAEYTAATKYNAKISGYKTTVGSTASEHGDSTFVSAVLNTAGEVTVKGEVTDSRGYSAAVEGKITVEPYSPPTLIPAAGTSAIVCGRANADGVMSDTGLNLRIRVGKRFSTVAGVNGCVLRYRIAEEGGAFGNWVTLLGKGSSADEISVNTDDTLDATKAYIVDIGVVDDVGESMTVEYRIPTLDVPLHLGRGGKNVGIGRYADYRSEYRVDVGWDVHLDSGARIRPFPGEERAVLEALGYQEPEIPKQKAGFAYNLLDNSDFSNPVNQRGQTSATTTGHFIDRWKVEAIDGTITIQDGYISLTENSNQTWFTQYIEPYIPVGTPVTLAMKHTNGNISLATTTISTSGDGYAIDGGNFWISGDDSGCNRVCLVPRAGTTWNIEWVALYEGEYTADTLPEYQPKGYAAEMMECMRYYRNFTDTDMMVTGLVISSTLLRFVLPLVMPMRVAPTVIYNGMTWLRAGGTNVSNPSTSLDSTYYRGSQIELNIKQPTNSVPYNNACVAQFSNGFALSADL